MSPHTLSIVLIRVLALFIFSMMLNYVPVFLVNIGSTVFNAYSFDYDNFFVILLSLAIPILIGGALWIKAPVLADKTLEGTHESAMPIDINSVHTIALSTVGVFIIITTLPVFVSTMFNWISLMIQTSQGFEIRRGFPGTLLSQALKIILGLLLIVKLQYWTQLLRRLQNID